jgi:hypothetical protein
MGRLGVHADAKVVKGLQAIAVTVLAACGASTAISPCLGDEVLKDKLHPPPHVIASHTNSAGCIETSIPYEVNGGLPGTFAFHWTRPPGLHPERLTNDEHDG